VTLSAAPYDDFRGIRFEMRDEGIGIPLDKQEIIFHRFTQADQSATRRFGGAGLGLSICREIVTALGGEIGVVSTPGEGATFRVDLPCALSTASAPLEADRWPASRAAADPGFDVVVVDDDPVSATLVAELARSMGRRSFVYGDAAAALGARAMWRNPLVFTDLHMPGLSGDAFVRALRGGGTPLNGVVMMTADVREPGGAFVRPGVDLVLHKPLDLKAASRVIDCPATLKAAEPQPLSA
jgi:CheY-like chemotaxis protein